MGLVEDLENAKRKIMEDTGMRPPAPFVIGARDFDALYHAARKVEAERVAALALVREASNELCRVADRNRHCGDCVPCKARTFLGVP